MIQAQMLIVPRLRNLALDPKLRVPCLLLGHRDWPCVKHIVDAWMNVQSGCASSFQSALSINSPESHKKIEGSPSQRSKENFQWHQWYFGLVLSDFQCLWQGGNGIVSRTSTHRISTAKNPPKTNHQHSYQVGRLFALTQIRLEAEIWDLKNPIQIHPYIPITPESSSPALWSLILDSNLHLNISICSLTSVSNSRKYLYPISPKLWSLD